MGVAAILPALYLMAALFGAVIPGPAAPRDGPAEHDVLLVHGPIHYDLLIPIDDMSRAQFAPLVQSGVQLDHPNARWLVVGWGARQFYTQTPSYREMRLSAIWRGMIGDRSVLRFDVVGALRADLPLRRLSLTDTEYGALLHTIWRSLELKENGMPKRLPDVGYGPTDGFYSAKGKFSLLRTCNVWIGDQLRQAGLRFGLWTPMIFSVSLSFDLYQSD